MDSEAIDQAISWHLRMRASDARAEDWDAFTGWLESDPAHAAAYDGVALADAHLGGLAANPSQATNPAQATTPSQETGDMPARPAERRRWFASPIGPLAAAAAAAALLVAVLSWPPAADPTLSLMTTAPGQTRVVALRGGSRIELNGDTRIAIDMDGARFARIDRGEASFFVRHDEARPFILEAGEYRLADTGTVFNVAMTPAELNVGVADGSVLFTAAGSTIPLDRGRTLRIAAASGRVELGREDPAAITGWRDGRLVYSGAGVATIAADLSRSLGRSVTVDAALANRRFTGVIIVGEDAAASVRRAAALLDAEARPKAGGWVLVP